MSDEELEGTRRKAEGKAASGFFPALSAVLALLLAGVVAFYNVPAFHALLHPHPADNLASTARAGDKYTCGMHPFIISDKPGNCPICGMALTKIEGPAAAAPSAPAPAASAAVPARGERKILFYRNPMDPGITSKTPAKDSMGMDYVPVYEDEAAGGGSGAGLPEGYAAVRVGMERVPLAGIRSVAAVREAISHPVRPSGSSCPTRRASAASSRRSRAGSRNCTRTSPGSS
jgi:Cu(I)/Ag(I) efflux system membrane fusion protein/cobalt-zinc-cadmium efflux system membrane fusion protein